MDKYLDLMLEIEHLMSFNGLTHSDSIETLIELLAEKENEELV